VSILIFSAITLVVWSLQQREVYFGKGIVEGLSEESAKGE